MFFKYSISIFGSYISSSLIGTFSLGLLELLLGLMLNQNE